MSLVCQLEYPFNHTKGERRPYPVPEFREDAGSNETYVPVLQVTSRDILLRLPWSFAYCRKPAITERDDNTPGSQLFTSAYQ